MTDGVLTEAASLRARREPHVLATVVWSLRPVSGKPGAKALVLPDGRVKGWVGGSCSEPLVVREAMDALADGRPRLLHLGPDTEGRPGREGVVVKSIACASEGAVEVFLEPVLPPPLVVVVGRAPLVRVLVAMAREIGFDTAVVERDPVAAEDMITDPDAVVHDVGDLAKLGGSRGSFVVVATMGRYDEDALEAALATDAAYVGLVASKRRGEAVLSTLRGAGVPEERLARVTCPAGLDLGAVAHEEIAVAILAELVQERASHVRQSPAPAGEEAVDPVCGMAVSVASATDKVARGGVVYYFCSGGCRRRFESDPERFASEPERFAAGPERLG